MTPIEKCSNLTKEQIDDEIKIRMQLKSEMVGWLYPLLMQSEIDELRRLRENLPQVQT